MSSVEGRPYRLTPRALEDLDEIWRYSAETWSIAQADRHIDELVRAFEALAAFPSLARERLEFSPPVRIHVHLDQLIVYVLADERVDPTPAGRPPGLGRHSQGGRGLSWRQL